MKRTIAFFLCLLLQCGIAGFVANASPASSDTDISAYSNVIYIQGGNDITVKDDGSVVISINMKNVASVTGYQFDLYLPSSLSASDVALAKSDARKASGVNFYSASQGDGVIRVLCYCADGNAFSGSDGEIATLTIISAKPGSYTFTLKGVELAASDVDPDNIRDNAFDSTVSVKGLLLGDANNSGEVNVADITAVVSHIYGKTPANFNKEAADVNKSGEINVADITAIVGIIYGKNK